MRDTTPFVSVIVPVYNNPAGIVRCVQALETQSYASDRYEVIVTDNGSHEPVEPLLKGFAHTRVVFESKPGSYAARNAAIAVARGDVFAFTDSDCVPRPDWLEAGVAALAREHGSVIAGQVEQFAVRPEEMTLIEQYETTMGFGQTRHVSRGFVATANMFASKAIFDAVGLFDDVLRSSGDAEWGRRATRLGHAPVYVSEVRVRHQSRRTFREWSTRVRRLTGGRYQLARRRGTRAVIGSLTPLLRPPIRGSWDLLHRENLGPMKMRWKAVLVVNMYRAIAAFEMLRLTLGLGKPIR